MILKNSIQFSFFCMFFLLNTSILAQEEIMWKFEYKADSNQVNMKASLKEHWHLYSQHTDENAGPVATTFTFEENEHITLIDSLTEPPGEEVYDENFLSTLTLLSDEVLFTQKLKVKKDTVLKGKVLYMICDDKGCLPPSVTPLEIKVYPTN